MVKKLENTVKYPNITVNLIGENGNAFVIMGLVQRALRKAGVSKEEIGLYIKEATSGDYDNLLVVTLNWVNVE